MLTACGFIIHLPLWCYLEILQARPTPDMCTLRSTMTLFGETPLLTSLNLTENWFPIFDSPKSSHHWVLPPAEKHMEKTNKHDKHGLKPFFLNSSLWVIKVLIVLLSISVVPTSMACTRKMYGYVHLAQSHSSLRSLTTNTRHGDCHFPFLNQWQVCAMAHPFFANKSRFSLRICFNIAFQRLP